MKKIDIIKKVHFDKSGFGSKQITLEDSKKVDKNMTVKDVNDFLDKHVGRKKNLLGYNSFVALEANYEYQIDLMFFSDLKNQRLKVGIVCIDIFSKGMVCIDIFSKKALVLAVKSKKEPDVAAGILECFK